ncbi:MAG: NAD(P)H-hydrate dehydratase [Myxococcota bacterium]|jgi:NAD(P)H-hydrate epimerase|nr:NAD(P)H-hydrate dehydratase [Myxococcota bacterium]
MSQHAWPLVCAEEMRALDHHTIKTLGVPGEVLMESAGRAVVQRVLANLTSGPGQVMIVCGRGNNGGDGFVVARHLAVLGIPVAVSILGGSNDLAGDAAANLVRLSALGIEPLDDPARVDEPAVVVDALFGTGLARTLEGEAAAHVEWIRGQRQRGAVVIAVDLPSGLDSDTGQVLGTAVEATETVTIGLPKIGLCLEPGRSCAGMIHVARIGIHDESPDVRAGAELWSEEAAAANLPQRSAAGHKGSFGHVLVVAGSRGKTGAAQLSSLGAARVGAGLVTVACPAGLNEILEVKTTEAMTAPVPDTDDHAFAAASASHLLALAEARDVVALGPGIGTQEETASLVHELAKRIERPLVIDADGLNAFAPHDGALAILKARTAASILTPHPGEAARLLGSTAGEINRDRVSSARTLASRSGGVVVLKGAATVIADPDGRVAINPTGGPALAAGGTGDVLTGLVAGLLAQGLGAFGAATLGVYLHGLAADRLASQRGNSGLLAHEIADELPATCTALREGRPASTDDFQPSAAANRASQLPERSRALLVRFPNS